MRHLELCVALVCLALHASRPSGGPNSPESGRSSSGEESDSDAEQLAAAAGEQSLQRLADAKAAMVKFRAQNTLWSQKLLPDPAANTRKAT